MKILTFLAIIIPAAICAWVAFFFCSAFAISADGWTASDSVIVAIAALLGAAPGLLRWAYLVICSIMEEKKTDHQTDREKTFPN